MLSVSLESCEEPRSRCDPGETLRTMLQMSKDS